MVDISSTALISTISTNKYTNGMLFSAKTKRVSSHKKLCKNLKCMLLFERSSSEKAKYYMIPIYNPRKVKAMETTKKAVTVKS
jgi:hypothetical protein